MPTNTYVALDTKTIVGSSTSSITFTFIPQGYTDLVIVEQSTGSVAAYSSTYFNGNNTGTNYSWTYMFGTGGSALSGRVPNLNRFEVSYHSTSATPNTMIYHVMNYSNSTTFKTMLSRYNLSNDGVGAYVGLWRQTSAITSITFESLSGTYTAGSTFTIYGVAAASVGAKATGGTIYQDASYFYHVFSGNGTFTPSQSISADVLVVAGGGSGGSQNGAGGGAGGVILHSSQSLIATNYTCTIGGGGAGVSGTIAGNNGVNSQFASLTAAVGGGGGGCESASLGQGKNGGSGGGSIPQNVGTLAGGLGTSGQGNNGGSGSTDNTTYRSGGGGGGASAVGSNGGATTTAGGNGGNGTLAYSSWLSAIGIGENVSGTYYIAGGGGSQGTPTNGIAGLGGATPGVRNATGASASANTGSGSGGAVTSGNGGSGIVIVRYAK